MKYTGHLFHRFFFSDDLLGVSVRQAANSDTKDQTRQLATHMFLGDADDGCGIR